MVFRLCGAWLTALASCCALAADPAWEHFKSRFVTGDGRVLDVYQGNISHSEGQAYAMLLAEHFQDHRLFDQLWTWTRNNLQVRHDALLAWNWGKRVNGEWIVIDYNNATDGDVLLAYALIRASERWSNASYAAEARKIVQAIRQHLGVRFGNHLLLLPGYTGFVGPAGFSFNPSYFVPTAYRKFAMFDDQTFWRQAEQGAQFMLQQACSNSSQLPPDWLAGKDGNLTNDERKGRHFGYEAVRVFLYASWGKNTQLHCSATRLLETFRDQRKLPARIDVKTGEFDSREAPGGFYAVLASTAAASGLPDQADDLRRKAAAKLATEPDDYYSHALFLLSRLAL